MTTHQLDFQRNTVQTTNGTQTLAGSYTVPLGAVVCLAVTFLALDGSNNAKTFELVGTAKNVGGSVSICGTVTSVSAVGDSGASAWTVTLVASGATVQAKVTGAAAVTINWCVDFDVHVYAP